MPDYALTRREREVVAQMALGKSNKEIAWTLGLTEGTIKVYLCNLKRKDPRAANRYTAVKALLRDHERQMAIRLNGWIQQYEDLLNDAAAAEIRAIMADQVSQLLA